MTNNIVNVSVRIWLTILMVFFAPLSITAMTEVRVPPLQSRVTDLTQSLSEREIAQLERMLTDFETEKGSQIAVLIVPTTQPETIEQYSIRVAEAWKLGRKGADDGVLLLVAKQDRVLRIEVGYGLEGALPDAIARRIIDEIIAPAFQQGNFFGGLRAGIEQIIGIIKGEPLPLPPSQYDRGASSELGIIGDNLIPILLVFLVLGKMMQTLLGRLAGAAITGSMAGVIIWLFFSSLVVAILIALVIFLISLFENSSRGYYRGGRGGWPLGRFGGGFGGGGFSGGGGSFGGGGASGRW
ncbi:YgcG family protein [Nitrosomonas sp.]|uniref:TPM domain-containing protein n=1 Tax=Nitrosomonas sp. TaxID=42353 RepID=UPI0026354E46|nr:YgcG family protein [Nitrosomonas sp.]MCW5602092.1 YgcG family protein [Nitrosomonas sp.]